MEPIVHLWDVSKTSVDSGLFPDSGYCRFKVVPFLFHCSYNPLKLHIVECRKGKEVDLEVTITTTTEKVGSNREEKVVAQWRVCHLNKKLPAVRLFNDQISAALSNLSERQLQLKVEIRIVKARPETGQSATAESVQIPSVSHSDPPETLQSPVKRQKIAQSSSLMDRSVLLALKFPWTASSSVSNVGKVPMNKNGKVNDDEMTFIDVSDDEDNEGSEVEQLKHQKDLVESQESEIVKLRTENANLEIRLLNLQSGFDHQKVDLQNLFTMEKKSLQLELEQSKGDLNKLKSELSDQRKLNDQNLEEISRQAILIDKKGKVEENLTSEIHRQSAVIAEKSKLEESLRAQLSNVHEEFEQQIATVNQLNLTLRKSNTKSNQTAPVSNPPGNVQFPSAATNDQTANDLQIELRSYPGWSVKYADFHFQTVDNYEFAVNKVKLSDKSEVFAAQFDSDMSAKQLGRDVLPDFTGDGFFELLKYICEGKLTDNFPYVIDQLYYAGDKYNLAELKEICEKQLVGQVSFDSICDSVKMAKMFGGNQLLAECLQFVWDHHSDPQMPLAQLGKICGEEADLLGEILELGVEKKSLKRKRK